MNVKKIHLFDIERQVWEVEHIRLAFCNPKEIEVEADYAETYQQAMWGELTFNDLARRVGAVVGVGHAFAFITGSGRCVGYSNDAGQLQQRQIKGGEENVIPLK